jgi:hypothetical protein
MGALETQCKRCISLLTVRSRYIALDSCVYYVGERVLVTKLLLHSCSCNMLWCYQCYQSHYCTWVVVIKTLTPDRACGQLMRNL